MLVKGSLWDLLSIWIMGKVDLSVEITACPCVFCPFGSPFETPSVFWYEDSIAPTLPEYLLKPVLLPDLCWGLFITRDLLTPVEPFVREWEHLSGTFVVLLVLWHHLPLLPQLMDIKYHGLNVGWVGGWKGTNAFFLFCAKQRWEHPPGACWQRGTRIRNEGILFAGPQPGCRGAWGARVSGPSNS